MLMISWHRQKNLQGFLYGSKEMGRLALAQRVNHANGVGARDAATAAIKELPLDEINKILLAAVQTENVKEVSRVLEASRDIDINLDFRHDGVETLLHKAGNVEIASLLLDHGASADSTNRNGQTALFEAVKKPGNIQLVKFLVEVGKADVNFADEDGYTPLHWCVFGWDPEVARFLVSTGADKRATEHGGLTPLLFLDLALTRYFSAVHSRKAGYVIELTSILKD